MFQTCVGEIGISPSEFWNISYKEAILAIRGYEKMQLRELERTRLIGYQIYAVAPKKGQNKPIHQYMPLPSDKLRNKVDPERRKAQREFFINKLKQEKNGKTN